VTTISHTIPFDVTSGAAATLRRWVGTVTWTRDLTTQVVTASVSCTRTEGTSNSGVYFYWPEPIPVEFRPEQTTYPDMEQGVSTEFRVDGLGYLYVYGLPAVKDDYVKYVTGAPVQEDELPPTDSFLGDINVLIEAIGVPVHSGYAPSGVALPYVVSRPLLVDTVTELAINGDAVDWDFNFSVYCCGASVEASFNLALAVIGTLQGARVRGTTLAASMGYNGAEVEGHYESQVTVQLNQGGLS
jgi:hypothetical protein